MSIVSVRSWNADEWRSGTDEDFRKVCRQHSQSDDMSVDDICATVFGRLWRQSERREKAATVLDGARPVNWPAGSRGRMRRAATEGIEPQGLSGLDGGNHVGGFVGGR